MTSSRLAGCVLCLLVVVVAANDDNNKATNYLRAGGGGGGHHHLTNSNRGRRRKLDEIVVDVVVDMDSNAVTFDSSWGDFVAIEHLDEDWDAAANSSTAGSSSRTRNLQVTVGGMVPLRPVKSLNMTLSANEDKLYFDVLGGSILQPEEAAASPIEVDMGMIFAINVRRGLTPLWGFGMEFVFGSDNDDFATVRGTCQRQHASNPPAVPFALDIAAVTKTSDTLPETCYDHALTGAQDDEHYKDCLVKGDMAVLTGAEENGNNNIKEWEVNIGCEHKFIDPYGTGDPHFMTWSGEKYDFHGECDLVLIDHPQFDEGAGMYVHARTRLMRHGVGRDRWSRIDSIAIQIGNDRLEMHGASQQHWINGKADVALPATIGGYQVREVPAPLAVMKRYVVDLGNNEKMWIKMFNEFVYFELEGSRADTFTGAYGLFGEYTTGHKVARDHKTIIDDPYEFGQEWQVRPHTDQAVFRNRKGVQYPRQCILPKKGLFKADASEQDVSVKRRRLGGGVTDKQARAACAKVDHWTRDECVFDVMATGDLDMAVAYL